MTKYITYYRVSTAKQGRSGLGMEAQQHAVAKFTEQSNVIRSFTETETGKRADRPELLAAMAACRAHGAILLIAKLDRLARNVAFVATLMQSDVKFVACDMPDADPFRLHIESAIAEEEARKISARTKAALAAAKARGVKLGGDRGYRITSADRDAGNKARIAAASQKALNVMPMIEEAQTSGASSLSQIGQYLNDQGIQTARGGRWNPMQVKRVMDRARCHVAA